MDMNNNAADVQQNKVMAVLSYIGILVLVPIFAAKESPYAKFHANQGLALLICEVAYNIVVRIIVTILNEALGGRLVVTLINSVLSLVSIAFLVFAIMGIVNAVNGETKELPIIGQFKILK